MIIHKGNPHHKHEEIFIFLTDEQINALEKLENKSWVETKNGCLKFFSGEKSSESNAVRRYGIGDFAIEYVSPNKYEIVSMTEKDCARLNDGIRFKVYGIDFEIKRTP